MPFLAELNPGKAGFDPDVMKQTGRELNEGYSSAKPFPHVVIDDFLPRSALDICLAEFKSEGQGDGLMFDRSQERLKREYKPDRMSADPRGLCYAFNSRPFIQFLENVTGINGLIPDPYFLGGGFHEILNGGHLSVHADFNHHVLMNLERRVNVLIYLNDNWLDEYGGQLELWDNAMTKCMVSVVPVLNRCVIFNTTSKSNHGNPQPVNHPDGVSRKSIALYYYTSTWGSDKRSHTTQFQVRRGTTDQTDWEIKRRELINDLVPPFLIRFEARVRAFVRHKILRVKRNR